MTVLDVTSTSTRPSLFDPKPEARARLPAGVGPFLVVMVDAEEEFDWSRGFSSTEIGVSTMRHQVRAQRLFERHRVVPTYLVDHPVAAQAEGYKPLREFLRDGRCEIGAQLHPWVNPPLRETPCERLSYPGNLPRELEAEKLRHLTGAIQDAFAVQPKIYRAGRWGAGPATADILAREGYEIDSSVLPTTDLTRRHGPDYSRCGARPYWFGGGLLEIPTTVALIGALAGGGPGLHRLVAGPIGEALRLPAICARSRLLDRVRLTPEGVSLDEARRLTRWLLARGQQVFVLTYHSPSLEPGHTPYVRSRADLDRFLAWIADYLAFFHDEIGGVAATPGEILRLARTQSP
ncbi:MAG: polysaccharide deacetylase family protein [Alphaproteobacteria bacterium]|nr:polysaccharide deacetylase family protein [Alphaproteobacteria bacterium]